MDCYEQSRSMPLGCRTGAASARAAAAAAGGSGHRRRRPPLCAVPLRRGQTALRWPLPPNLSLQGCGTRRLGGANPGASAAPAFPRAAVSTRSQTHLCQFSAVQAAVWQRAVWPSLRRPWGALGGLLIGLGEGAQKLLAPHERTRQATHKEVAPPAAPPPLPDGPSPVRSAVGSPMFMKLASPSLVTG